ncbi:Allantoate amidohydrolase [Sodalis praecaptivus]|uniref:Allantoate amidohydrolase n=1 Tax=Sodalis praecaptivus TaxID=1239307 RepID=W0HXC6_9GAMM|nr:Zn-dependent hydrolase [Sodalis praecaptivus]AHF76813.1 Allantoate amidohydrolase [Sodalis praecaptivus]
MRDQPLPAPDIALAQRLFTELQQLSFDGRGISRDSYGEGEQRAHDVLHRTARALGLRVATDAALNLYMTLPGTLPGAPAVITGSHLDSVPCGGNFDGAAGVLAGIAVLAGWVAAGYRPQRDVTVMAIRAEESAWFPISYLGSKAAFGLLPPSAMQTPRADNGRTLAQHFADRGADAAQFLAQPPWLSAAAIACFIELHIEQGPVLLNSGIPLGLVSGICGSLRYRAARCVGRYAHSGATPRGHRQDAVVATAALVTGLHLQWGALEQEGHELTVTVGQFATHPQQADFSKVSGEVAFCLDFRSRSPQTLSLMDAALRRLIDDISLRHGVRFELGEQTESAPAQMDPALLADLTRAAEQQRVPARVMPSGAGHDAALFAAQGVPTAMLFVRNANGSHNPAESMALADFAAATGVLAALLARRSDTR